MTDPNQINNETQSLVQSQNTYQFFASACGLAHRLRDFITSCTTGSGRQLEDSDMPLPALSVPDQVTAASSRAREDGMENGAFLTNRSDGRGATGLNISGNTNWTSIGVNRGVNNVTYVNNYGNSHGLSEHMKEFVSFNALHDSSVQDPDRKCHPGTRQVVLKRIRNWIDNSSSPERIFWLYGPAGAGKSAIAQTIAHSYSQEQVAATFFFYKSDATRNDGNRLFPTIAWQLALLIPAIKEHIARSLDKRPDLPRKNIETQFEEFIVHPFQALKGVPTHLPSLVVIIDGVDECTDERIQRRFLKIIRNAIEDDRVPLRFLICSRPEAHIQEAIDRFPEPKLLVDLATLDDANHDIEKYLRDEFSRIASEQDLNSTWPGDERIQQFVYKSSGNFVYAATVIRYVGDEYNSAISQLDIILGLKPQSSKSPFAELDALYLEILERQPDRDFLITFLAVLVARLSLDPSDYEAKEDFHLDDAMLMNMSDTELHRKLRGMRSLFKFDPHIDLYHRSFLDFLQDSSRSLQFYTSKKNAQRQYLDLITDSIVRFTSKTIDRPDHHELGHFDPSFNSVFCLYPPRINLPVAEWHEALQPLLCLQDKLLSLPNFVSTWNFLPCNTCIVFQIMRDLLLHLLLMQGTYFTFPSTQTIQLCSNNFDVNSNAGSLIARGQPVHEIGLAGCIDVLLLTQAERAKLEPLVDMTTINHICSLLRFDCVEIAKRVCSVANAQLLIDLIDSLTNDDYFLSPCGPDIARKAALLGLKIYARVPVLPRSLFSNSDISLRLPGHWWHHWNITNFSTICQSVLLSRILDHNYIFPLSRIYAPNDRIRLIDSIGTECKSLSKWRKTSNPSPVEIMRAMLEVANAIRYLHSLGVVFNSGLMELDDVYLDSKLHAKIHYMCSTSTYITETPSNYLLHGKMNKRWNSHECNVFIFGCFFYEIYFDTSILVRWDCDSRKVSNRPSEPKIREDAWQLIQRCCAEDNKARPTMDQVVQEMESWNLV